MSGLSGPIADSLGSGQLEAIHYLLDRLNCAVVSVIPLLSGLRELAQLQGLLERTDRTEREECAVRRMLRVYATLLQAGEEGGRMIELMNGFPRQRASDRVNPG
jgi:hypothetical protein